MRPPHLFIFGLGYVGLRAGIACERELGWRVSGCCRSAEKAEAISAAHAIEAHTFDLDENYAGLDAGGLAALADATHVLATTPPVADFDRDPLLALHTPELLCSSQLHWAGYLSTTSVYGDHDGEWVDEESETRATAGSSGYKRLAAENEWLQLEASSDGRMKPHVFRLAGIYGPGRSALDTVKRAAATRGEEVVAAAPSPSPPEAPAASPSSSRPRYVSRVYVDDICSALLASMQQEEPPPKQQRVYNIADDEPTPRGEVMAFAASLLDAPRAAAADADAAVGGGGRARRRATENKRVSNKRMRTLLPELAYPTYREGLRQIAQDS